MSNKRGKFGFISSVGLLVDQGFPEPFTISVSDIEPSLNFKNSDDVDTWAQNLGSVAVHSRFFLESNDPWAEYGTTVLIDNRSVRVWYIDRNPAVLASAWANHSPTVPLEREYLQCPPWCGCRGTGTQLGDDSALVAR